MKKKERKRINREYIITRGKNQELPQKGGACLYYTHTQTNDEENSLPKKCLYRPQIITNATSHWLESIGLPDLACEIRLA